MSIAKFLLLSCLSMAALIASTVRADEATLDPAVTPTSCGLSCCGESCCDAPCGCSGGYSCCDKDYRSDCCGHGGPLCNVRVHDCGGKVCMSKVEEVTEERSCWKIECEEICVPRVVCPWGEGGSGLTLFNCFKKHHGCGGNCGDACCADACGCGHGCLKGCNGMNCCMTPRCGDVRCVRVLDSEDYECTGCECVWDIKEGCYRYGPSCGHGGLFGHGCGHGRGCGCGAGNGCCDGMGCGDGCAKSETPAAGKEAVAQSTSPLAQAFNVQTVSDEQPASSSTDEPTAKKSAWKFWK